MSRRRAALATAALVVLSGCETRLLVGVNARSDGSGRVTVTATLDREAADRLRAAGSDVRTDDLERAGWAVSGPSRSSDGTTVVHASKRFADPGEARRVVTEVNGPEGPAIFRDFRLTRHRSFAKTTTRFSGVVDLRAGLEGFGDAGLERRTGAPLGVEVSELERQAGVIADRFLQLRIGIRLPGDIQSNAPLEDGSAATWRVRLGQEAHLAAAASTWNTANLALATVATLAALALVTLLLSRRLRRRA